MNKAVFFDKDGTLIPDIPYNKDVNLITFNEGAQNALHKLSEHGFLLIIISNQSGIAKGFMTEDDLAAVKQKLEILFEEAGVQLNGFYYCPHDKQGTVPAYSIECNCRKPKPGMLLQASADHSIDLNSSWFIGDILNDMEAGNRAGCCTIMLDNGNETEWQSGKFRTPGYKVTSLVEAADIIIDHVYQHQEVII